VIIPISSVGALRAEASLETDYVGDVQFNGYWSVNTGSPDTPGHGASFSLKGRGAQCSDLGWRHFRLHRSAARDDSSKNQPFRPAYRGAAPARSRRPRRFAIGFTVPQKADLVAFLGAL
jgi:hypothetical protein